MTLQMARAWLGNERLEQDEGFYALCQGASTAQGKRATANTLNG
jgi:hypothetical protein